MFNLVFLDIEENPKVGELLYYYVLCKIATSCDPQTVIILKKNEKRPIMLQTFKLLIEESKFGQITKESTFIHYTAKFIEIFNSKIFVKSSVQSLIGMKADLVIVGEEFEDQFYDLVPYINSREVIFKFLKPEEKIEEENVNFFDIAREESFSSSLFNDVSEIISKIGRENLSELIFFIEEEKRLKERYFDENLFEQDKHKLFQRLEIMNNLNDLYLRKRTIRLFNQFKIYEICECFNELFPSWRNYQNVLNCRSNEKFLLEKHLSDMKQFIEENSIICSGNKFHTECQVVFNKVFFSNLDSIIEVLEKKKK
jgi:hypothetical protein